MLKMKIFWLIFRGKFEQKTQKSIFLKNQWRLKNIKKAMVVKNIIAEDMPFTKSIFEQFWRSYCKKTIFVVFHFLKFLPIYVQTTDSKMPTTTFFVREDAGCQLNNPATILLVIASGRNNLTSYRSVFFTLPVANLPAIKRERTSLEICEELNLQMGFLGCENLG